MLEPPPVSVDLLRAHLDEARGVSVATIEFLPLGADASTAVYRAVDANGAAFLVKLRRGTFAAASVAVPRWLADTGIDEIIPPLPDLQGRVASPFGEYSVSLYPFVAGQNAYAAPVTNEQRRELGRALRAIHAAAIPPALLAGVLIEDFAPGWRELTLDFLARAEREIFAEAVAAEMAAFMRAHASLIRELAHRAAALAEALRSAALPRVLCHADLHAGNLHITPEGRLYLVDWDTIIMAPKERDLMYVGAGIDRVWRGAGDEDAFYAGYGHTDIDLRALAYYRCERAVEDIAAFCSELLLTTAGGADRAQSLRYFKSAFEEGDAVDIALRTPLT